MRDRGVGNQTRAPVDWPQGLAITPQKIMHQIPQKAKLIVFYVTLSDMNRKKKRILYKLERLSDRLQPTEVVTWRALNFCKMVCLFHH